MAARDFIQINNYSGLGHIGISRASIAMIASTSLKEVEGVTLYSRRGNKASSRNTELGALLSVLDGVKVTFGKDGRALIAIDVSVTRGVNVAEACEKIQEHVATAVALCCDMVPFDVRVKVMKIVG